jgi:hypothetical protein
MRVLGCHPVEASEPVHLIEIQINADEDIDFGQITQEVVGQAREYWQAPWDERELSTTDGRRFVFFFHYLDTTRPILTSLGEIDLPVATPIPAHLSHIAYEQP